MRCCGSADKTYLGFNLDKLHVIGSDSQIACEIPIIPAAGNHSVDTGNRRLAKMTQRSVCIEQSFDPFLKCFMIFEMFINVLLNIAAYRKGTVSGACKNENCNAVVARSVTKSGGHLTQCVIGVSVVGFGPIDRNARDPIVLLVN